ncbi:MAG: VanZ family protein [Bryobacteraceae bacterium]|jgi:VanZ family protein
MSAKILDLLCIAVLCTILTLGLWPFHSPTNDVTWLSERNGLRFGSHGTVIGSRAFDAASSPGDQLSGSLEIWLQPARVPDSSTLLAFSTPEDPFRFSLHESQTDLRLQAAAPNDRNRTPAVKLYVNDVFRKARPVFITITAGKVGMAVYIDGVLAKRAPWFRLTANRFSGRIILGDSPGQSDSFTGQLLGFAIYDRELTGTQLLRHYQTWTYAGRPEIQQDEGNLALYLFDERAGNVVHNRVSSGGDLSILAKYVVLDQIFLEPFWREFNLSWSYWGAALKNIVGFVPFGFCFFARLSMAHGVKRAALMAVLAGALVSVTIEILQSHLPTRDSGMTDIVTNTFGTWVGVMSFRGKAARVFFAALSHWTDAQIVGARRV